ncbi:MAG: hypothetical protein LC799_04395 [Actinobacteria bacterium]|nr:hypothetical protein [Actinomycetota bacterium]
MSANGEETFRGTLQGCTPDSDSATVIVTRKGLGRNGRVWLTFNGSVRATLVMTDQQTGRLVDLLDAAQGKH